MSSSGLRHLRPVDFGGVEKCNAAFHGRIAVDIAPSAADPLSGGRPDRRKAKAGYLDRDGREIPLLAARGASLCRMRGR
jgi:hypothetical protein